MTLTSRFGFAAAVLLVLTPSASAQLNPESGDVAQQPQPGVWQPPVNQMPPPQPMAAPAPAPTDSGVEAQSASTDDDHSAVVGRMGVGFFGVSGVPILVCINGDPTCVMTDNDAQVSVPTIGARYWLADVLGIEAALGLNVSSSSAGVFESSQFGLALHGGVPLALAYSGHFVFEVVPQLNFGIASGSYENTMLNTTADTSGLLIEVGATVGAEIHFGFIDLPNLSLQGTVGLSLRSESRSVETRVPAGGPTGKFETSALTISTGMQHEPWEIFAGSIAAIYYL